MREPVSIKWQLGDVNPNDSASEAKLRYLLEEATNQKL